MNTTRIFIPALLLTACGGGFTSDLEAERRASTLSVFEAVDLCESASKHISSLYESPEWVEYFCTTSSVNYWVLDESSSAMSRSSCEAGVFECTGSSELYGETYASLTDCTEIDDYDYEDCPATVAEIEACVDEYRDATAVWVEEVTCDVASNWRPSRQLSSRCQVLIEQTDCDVFFFGD